ncbi:zf-HC2 domain-containing protein [Streptomyces sp. NPDC002446]
MHCSRIRTALSARLDGEELPPGITTGRLDGHLAGCPACRQWEARARALTAHLGIAAAPTEGDPAAADALLAALRSASAGPVSAPPGIAGTDGERAG